MCHAEVIQRVRWAQIGLSPGRVCRKTWAVRPHVEQMTVEKVQSLGRCCPHTGEGASFRLSTLGLFYQTKIYCAPNLQKRWHALCSALSLAVMLQTKVWNLGPFQKFIYICSCTRTRSISRRNTLHACSMDLLLCSFLYEIWKQICRDEPPWNPLDEDLEYLLSSGVHI